MKHEYEKQEMDVMRAMAQLPSSIPKAGTYLPAELSPVMNNGLFCRSL